MIVLLTCGSAAGYVAIHQTQAANARETWGNLAASFDVHLQEEHLTKEKVLDALETISDTYGVSILKTTYDGTDGHVTRSGIFHAGYEKALGKEALVWGTFCHDLQWIANQKLEGTEGAGQCGQIRNVFQAPLLVVQTLQRDFAMGEGDSGAGLYTLTSMDGGLREQKEEILGMLSGLLDIPVESMEQASFQVAHSSSSMLVVCLILLGLFVVIYSVLCLFLPWMYANQSSVRRLHGYSAWQIWSALCQKTFTGSIVIASALVLVLLKAKYPEFGARELCALLGIWVVVWAVAWVLSYLPVLVWCHQPLVGYLKKKRIPKLAMFLIGGLKCGVVLSFAITLPVIVQGLSQIQNLYQLQQHARALGDVYTLDGIQYQEDQFQEMLEGRSSLEQPLARTFALLEQKVGAGYVRTMHAENLQSDVVYMNQNYARHYLGDWLTTSLSDMPTDKSMVIVPAHWSQAKIDTARSSIETSLSSEKNPQPALRMETYQSEPADLPVDASDLWMAGQTHLQDPVIVVLSPQQMQEETWMLFNSASRNPIRLFSAADQWSAIESIVQEMGLEKELKFDSLQHLVFQTAVQDRLHMCMLWGGISLFAFLMSVFSGVSLLLLMLKSRRKEMLVKKLHGYGVFERFGQEISFFATAWVCAFALVVQLMMHPPVWMHLESVSLFMVLSALCVLAAVDLMISLWAIHKADQNVCAQALKMEEL